MNIACLSFTDKGSRIGESLKSLENDKYKIKHYANKSIDGGIKGILRSIWREYDGIVFISASGIAVRMSAALLEDKTLDPAVVVIDDLGRYAISLLSGHIGGANKLAEDLSEFLGSLAIITTATDGRGIESLDIFAKNNGYYIEDMKSLTRITAMMVNNEKIGLYTEDSKMISYNKVSLVRDLKSIDSDIKGLIVVSSCDKLEGIDIPYSLLRPKNLNIGIGCRKGIEASLIIKAIDEDFKRLNLSKNSIKSIGTVEVKRHEKGIIDSASYFNCPLKILKIKEIEKVEMKFEKSQFVKDTIGVYSVSGPVAFLLGGSVISEKTKHNGITISISKEINNG